MPEESECDISGKACRKAWTRLLAKIYEIDPFDSLFSTGIMTIDTIFGKRLYLLLIIQLKTIKIVQRKLTEHPCREFVRQQIIDIAFENTEPITLTYDNYSAFISIDYSQYGIKGVNTSC